MKRPSRLVVRPGEAEPFDTVTAADTIRRGRALYLRISPCDERRTFVGEAASILSRMLAPASSRRAHTARVLDRIDSARPTRRRAMNGSSRTAPEISNPNFYLEHPLCDKNQTSHKGCAPVKNKNGTHMSVLKEEMGARR